MCLFSIILCLIVGLLVSTSLYLWGALLVVWLFPRSYAKEGDKIHIYINGSYNRTATINKIASDRFYIYEKVKIPVGYRGRFFAITREDNVKLVYIKNRKLYRLIPIYLFAKWMFAIPDDEHQLPESESFKDPEDSGDDEEDDKSDK